MSAQSPAWVVHPGRSEFAAEVRAAQSRPVSDLCAGHGPYGDRGLPCPRCGYPAGRRVIELGTGR